MRSSLAKKLSIISNGLQFDLDMFASRSEEYYENTYGYCVTNRGVERGHRLPQVLLLGDELVVSVLRREGSPWSLRFEGEDLCLYHEGRFSQVVGLPEALPFFGKELSDGVLTDDVISAYGAVTPGFFLYPDCHYFDRGAQCRFCSLRAARSTVAKPLVKDFPRQRIMEATRHIQNSGWRVPMITNTTGTPLDDEGVRRTVLEPLRAIHDACDPKIKMHLLTHPPQDLGLIEEYKRAGVTSIAFNIEIYDRDLFASICPGKDRLYGYDKWWDALDAAREVFGDYQVYCGIIWGLEPLASSMEGMEAILDRRIGLATNVFHADPGTAMARRPQPSVADITALAEREAELYRKYPDAGTIYDVSMRNTIDWEVRNGYMG
ncbi:radical SAM protein [Kitasatospora cathayae]